MNARKKSRLEAAGFRVGDAQEFLGLTAEEQKVIDLRLRLATLVRELRTAAGMTQQELADKIGSKQPRIAKLESGSPGVSLDQQFHTFFALGGSLSQLVQRERKTRTRGPVKPKAGTSK